MIPMTKDINHYLRSRCVDRVDEAKRVRNEYGHGHIPWEMAKKLILRLGYLPNTANGILLGTRILPGD